MNRDTATAPASYAFQAFQTIEGAHAYVAQLLEAVETTTTEVGEDLRSANGLPGQGREALQLVAYELEQLRFHLATSRRRLQDLRMLRELLHTNGRVDRVSL